jgi:hypothetical protein
MARSMARTAVAAALTRSQRLAPQGARRPMGEDAKVECTSTATDRGGPRELSTAMFFSEPSPERDTGNFPTTTH